ncbi:MAG: L-aspartate oxidase [Phycisphaerae bacterium]|nr:L-aspartate oxidase [Phycisphaerae bacterium]
MNNIFQERRYLLGLDSRRLNHHFTDCLIIGSGVAGLRAAVEASRFGQALVVTKDSPTESNTFYAQGGVAAVLSEGDTVESHLQDTLIGGAGLCDEPVVRVVVDEGPRRVRELIDWGAVFDSDHGHLVFTREGGHTHSRIVHAHGDATGKEIARSLLAAAGRNPAIELMDHTFVVDLITDERDRCRGVVAWRKDHGVFIIWAGATVLASGGAGQLYRESTNPAVATADGHAIAWRAGATLSDMEMVQFHPTTLYVAGASRALITEAVRGEGAYLIDRNGERFMPALHPQAELAPRDIVSRAIVQRMEQTHSTYVQLDCRHIGRQTFARRFPGIYELLESFDIDVGTTPIPVRPAAHYMIGGLKVDMDGRTTVPGLYACGEATASGLHGANRLGSNSLLEGMVFGARAGAAAGAEAAGRSNAAMGKLEVAIKRSERTPLDITDVRNSLRSLMGRNLGVEREGARMTESAEIIDFWARYVMDKTFTDPVGWELQNMLTVSRLLVASAMRRTESRGVHYRLDHPQTDDANWQCHLDVARGRETELRPVQTPKAGRAASR